ncbi:hypothetical protein BG015_006906 [Linnemannia schmuckeri]|uniref:Uncharacterized protein n=1 Tax=Linnemannia schmuckeri TaxID=64567 RepID=A0A9P5RZ82_9FUNG|nr:hypothetical protein BG015_006906 [Linnemannia schmuckeri]
MASTTVSASTPTSTPMPTVLLANALRITVHTHRHHMATRSMAQFSLSPVPRQCVIWRVDVTAATGWLTETGAEAVAAKSDDATAVLV